MQVFNSYTKHDWLFKPTSISSYRAVLSSIDKQHIRHNFKF